MKRKWRLSPDEKKTPRANKGHYYAVIVCSTFGAIRLLDDSVTPLFAHQTSGAIWLAERRHAYLGDVPGLGKTRTLLTAAAFAGAKHPLVVCPAIVRTHWLREEVVLDLFDDLDVMSYDEIVRGKRPRPFDAVILDEAHYLKNPLAQRTRVMLGKDGFARNAPIVYCGSGTPVPRHPGEFWPILSSLWPEVAREHALSNYRDFEERFLVTTRFFARGAWREKVVGMKNENEFKSILTEVMLRRTIAEVGLDVPRVFWQTIMLDAESIHEAGVWARYGMSLLELARDPEMARYRRNVGLLKVKPVVEMLVDQLAESDEQVVVFANHTDVLRGLRNGLTTAGLSCSFVDGSTSRTGRDFQIDRFQKDTSVRVFIGQNIACQAGITLHRARRCILVEPDWTATVNEQLAARIARIGSTADHCIAQMITLAGTLDEYIVRQIARETEIQERLFT